MVRISSLKELREMPDSVVRRAMEANALLCHDGDEEVMAEMEEEFEGPLGGNWYQFEGGDDPRSFPLGGDCPEDLLGDEWNWCDAADIKEGCFVIFWGVNNAGGPCLFVVDEPWIPAEFRARLETLVARESA